MLPTHTCTMTILTRHINHSAACWHDEGRRKCLCQVILDLQSRQEVKLFSMLYKRSLHWPWTYLAEQMCYTGHILMVNLNVLVWLNTSCFSFFQNLNLNDLNANIDQKQTRLSSQAVLQP